MAAHLIVPVTEQTQVGEARRAAVRMATSLGFDELGVGKVALIATELGTNLVKHAKQGRLLLKSYTDASPGRVELISLDQGPGITDVSRCLRDGYSTTGTQGSGLGAVRRTATSFGVYSRVGEGTVIAADVCPHRTVNPQAAETGLQVAGISIPAPGETACGDAWAVRERDAGRVDVIVADGLGHGPDAEKAAVEAIDVFQAMGGAGPTQILERAHERLKSTRGAAVTVAAIDGEAGRVVLSGAGNIAGRIVSGVEDRSLLSQHGTVGYQMRRLQDIDYDWPPHAVLVFHSDGIVTRWTLDEAPGLLQCEPIVIAAWLICTRLRGRDDATVVVIRRP